ncbi:hypothetical protein HBH70_187800 [Parastagonospora nodorum]|nr:hypothetical protein HBH51_229180 [Parastagonospora nodorum]KAH4195326.1 hypothetical protein HBI95_197020 [Parastagonospora nodorum]KAH4952716.1 hypothetical protein HBI78_236220 [Parastagonospora nodorum]KAH5100649.1 hypothetical protein HBH71_230120 [Parastagonospora nodorum]KAH5130718.1 hypothetical protein HBH70_187800 [Parastagonospora nodorum]
MSATDRKDDTDTVKASAQHIEEHGMTHDAKDAAIDAAAQGQTVVGYETLTVWQTVKTFKVSTAVCFAAALSAATDGYQIGINSSIIANQGFVNKFATAYDPLGKPYLESPIISGFGTIQSVGQIIGMVTLPFISSRFGRKWALYTLWFILACSILTESLATAWPHWLVAKLLSGIGVGCMQTTLPTYISEVAPNRIRGGLLMCYSLWFSLGQFFAIIALQRMNTLSPLNFRTPILTQWAQIGLMAIIYLLIPESPSWCVSVGNSARAKRELKKLNRGVKDFNLEQNYQALVLVAEHEKAVAIEQKRENWYAIFQELTQLVGLTLFGTYGTYFFQQAGLKDPFAITCITSSLMIATAIVVIFLADPLGRRWIGCGGVTLSWLCCLVIGILGVTKTVRASEILFVMFSCLSNVGISASGAAGWASVGEMSSQRLRPYTAGFAAALSCVAGVVMNQLVPYMVNENEWNWGYKTGWFYAGIGLPAVAGMWLLVPETTGRSAAELDELFNNKVRPWRFAKTETATQRLLKVEASEYLKN